MTEENLIQTNETQDVKPTRIIVNKADLSPDSPAVREGYDSRIIPPNDLPDEVAHFYLFDFFNFSTDDKHDEVAMNKLRVIHDWGRKRAGSHDVLSIIQALRSQETRLGTPELGTNRLTNLYRFAKISLIVDDLEAERDSYLR